MNKFLSLIVAVISSSFSAGCASTFGNYSAFEEKTLLDHGSSEEEVQEALGHPGEIETRGNKEAWKYCKNNLFAPNQEYLIIWIHDEQYVDHKTFTQRRGYACGSNYPKVAWDSFPETSASR